MSWFDSKYGLAMEEDCNGEEETKAGRLRCEERDVVRGCYPFNWCDGGAYYRWRNEYGGLKSDQVKRLTRRWFNYDIQREVPYAHSMRRQRSVRQRRAQCQRQHEVATWSTTSPPSRMITFELAEVAIFCDLFAASSLVIV
jgi:hypothetical protein